MRILLTNTALAHRTGSELYLVEVALKLLERGHSPVAFSTRLGPLAQELRAATVPVVDRLDAVSEPPDLIHGQHHLETMTALLHFPGVPVLSVCHGWLPWEEVPPRSPRIRRYLAVDWTTRDRLVSEQGIPPEQVEVFPNFVDLARFQPRAPLPPVPRRALVFSNHASDDTFLPAVREACSRLGLAVDVTGIAAGLPSHRPQEVLPRYDLVFAKGRGALEALAVGCAVVLCDQVGAGPLVTRGELDRLRRLNFGIRTLRHPVEPGHLAGQIERYDAADAAEVSRRIRDTAGIETAVDRLLEIYGEVLARHRELGNPCPQAESRAAADYLRWLSPYIFERYERAALERDHFQARAAAVERDRDSLREHTGHLAAELRSLQETAAFRLRGRLLRSAPLRRAYRFLRRLPERPQE